MSSPTDPRLRSERKDAAPCHLPCATEAKTLLLLHNSFHCFSLCCMRALMRLAAFIFFRGVHI